jgi:hypothetical protein
MSSDRILSSMSSILFVVVMMAAGGCKTQSSDSGVLDTGLSPKDVTKPTTVLWLTTDNKVHLGVCPAFSSVVNRTCTGITEDQAPVDFDEYKDKLKAAILRQRPGGGPKVTAATIDPATVLSLETKIKRLEDKVASGTFSTNEVASFKKQLEKLNGDYSKVNLNLTGSEQKDFDDIIKYLDVGQDVTHDEGERRYNLAKAGFAVTSKLKTPPFEAKDEPMDVSAVLEYWNDIADKFYDKKDGYTAGTPPTSINDEPLSTCLSACPAYYSTLFCHIYCWHPSYKDVVPNVRGCFSQIARGAFAVKKNNVQVTAYPEIFDYCMYQDFDPIAVKNGQKPLPDFNQTVIDDNKAKINGTGRIGVLKYMSPSEEAVFKYWAYTWYNPFAFSEADQQAVLDQFYATHPGVVSQVPRASHAGKSMHPDTKTVIEPVMQAVDAGTL